MSAYCVNLQPIQCFTCGNIISAKYAAFKAELMIEMSKPGSKVGKTKYLAKDTTEKSAQGKLLDEMGITRLCCRRHFLTDA